ncbi:MAG: metal ABC transporter permease [Hyphomicrobiaceae bacterium]|nr:MAG: metal ABC transporter permease [Hyphomicrobiaceae bacterium]
MSPYELLIAPFYDFAFMRRALAGSIALSAGAAPVGVFLMLRRMSLVGDAMAHAILPGAAIAFLLFGLSIIPMTIGGIAAGLLVVIASGLVARSTRLMEDASLAAFYLISLSLGVLIVSAKGTAVDLMHVLFGSVLALDDAALFVLGLSATLSLFALAVIIRPLVMECVDPTFIKVAGGGGAAAHMAFLVLLVVNLVAGFQALGTLLSVGIMMLPALAARFWADSLSKMMAVSVLIAMGSSFAGLVVSFHLSLASGPAIALAAGVAYIVSVFAGPSGGLIWELLPQRHHTA